ncbi:hypothetical protein SAMN05216168_4457 [Kosakonia radicincitans]|uniref:hypothetical protein n=1 Tax=Kosakonia radicincitans TaxID=283686 RepID=UPI0009A70533|nr:hypothetical protein [Kosakonia radicincitans]SKC22423.1 hypothetical protein SAMN05216168_4457 [Kosakonia radicincitans]
MKLKLTPQRSDIAVEYSSDGSVLTVKVDGASDTFDFSEMNEGDFAYDFQTSLGYNPLISATVEDGELTILAIKTYGIDAGDRERENSEVTL